MADETCDTPRAKTQRPGLACCHCGCRLSRVLRVTPRADLVVRRHQCRGCGKLFNSYQTIRCPKSSRAETATDGSLYQDLRK
ncbi:MAG TPA: hypothetical protein VKJ47_14125 [Candidatus Binatia bacterium]|nr:hypothetical protein [Candidatus Binatia bacterium]